MNEHLKGLTLLSIRVVDCDIQLVTKEKGVGIIEAEGDCCATAWVESINPCSLPAVITDWEHRSGHSEDEDTHHQLDYDFYMMSTTQGYIDIEMRCSHNGWYSGRLRWAGWQKPEVPEPIDFGTPHSPSREPIDFRVFCKNAMTENLGEDPC